jgi:Ca-activated chloride channel family protein
MTTLRLVLGLTILVTPGLVTPVGGWQNPPQGIVIGVEIIRVPTTVLDRRGRFVRGLKQQDFELFEDGVAQTLTSFKVEESAIRAQLLLDVSGSMNARIDDVKRAAGQFIRHVGPKDLIKVVQFDQDVTPLVDFTGDRGRLDAAIKSVAGRGGSTSLHMALWTALAELEAEGRVDQEEQRHRALIVLTDGDDTGAFLKADEVVARARRVDALIYGLSLERQNGLPVTNGPASLLLRQLAELSGGNLQYPELTNLNRHYQDLAEQLRQQYVLGYVSSNESVRVGWRRITVNVKNRTNLNLRYRQGYHFGSRQP